MASAGCGILAFGGSRPAAGYEYGSGAPLRIAVIDDTVAPGWSDAVASAMAVYGAAEPRLEFSADTASANIVVTVRDYDDAHPPPLPGYVFPIGAGGFAAVYDTEGTACNFPPSTLPTECSGEIASADVYVNNIIPPGPDIAARRERLLLHEMGHAMGLTRHSPDLDLADLALRYGWPAP